MYNFWQVGILYKVGGIKKENQLAVITYFLGFVQNPKSEFGKIREKGEPPCL